MCGRKLKSLMHSLIVVNKVLAQLENGLNDRLKKMNTEEHLHCVLFLVDPRYKTDISDSADEKSKTHAIKML